MENRLPELCFTVLPRSGDLICLKRGETGYYPSDWSTDDPVKNRELADYNNRRLGVSFAIECAFRTASMTNWSVPGADPQFYLDHAELLQSTSIHGHIKDDVMTVYYPIEGLLYSISIDGRPQTYIAPEALPPSILGVGSNLTIQPEMVGGRPLVQVDAVQSENGSYTISLAPHCFSRGEQEVNSGYQICMRMTVDNYEIAMAQQKAERAQYTTWLRTLRNDKDGSHNFYWGHYSTDRAGSIADFCERAQSEHRFLQERKSQQHQNKKRQHPER